MTHPNVVTVFDLGYHTDGSPYIVMEYLKGQDLQKRLRQPPPLPLERKVAIIVQVLAGLAHAHQAGHRPPRHQAREHLDPGRRLREDHGLRRRARRGRVDDRAPGNIVGTADYMSPEQAQGKKVDGRSDLFSVGCMLYELVTGRRPFHADDLMAIFYKITARGRRTTRSCPPAEPYQALVPILRKALARDVAERYERAYDFAVDLREWLKAHGGAREPRACSPSLVDLEAPTHAPLQMTDACRARRPPGAATTIDATDARSQRRRSTAARRSTRGRDRRARAPRRAAGAPSAGRPWTPGRRAAPARRPPGARRRARPAGARARASCRGWRSAWRSSPSWWRRARLEAAAGARDAAGTQALAPPPTRRARADARGRAAAPPPTPAPQPTFARGARARPRRRSAPRRPRSGPAATSAPSPRRRRRCARTPATRARRRCSTTRWPARRRPLELRRRARPRSRRATSRAPSAQVDAARQLAPWDAAAAGLAARIADARARAEREAQAKAQQARCEPAQRAAERGRERAGEAAVRRRDRRLQPGARARPRRTPSRRRARATRSPRAPWPRPPRRARRPRSRAQLRRRQDRGEGRPRARAASSASRSRRASS